MKYRKKPVVIEAFCFRYDNCPDWFMDKVTANEIITYEASCIISTLEGNKTALKGDYIIKGIHGEIYPCNPKIFLEIYEAVL